MSSCQVCHVGSFFYAFPTFLAYSIGSQFWHTGPKVHKKEEWQPYSICNIGRGIDHST